MAGWSPQEQLLQEAGIVSGAPPSPSKDGGAIPPEAMAAFQAQQAQQPIPAPPFSGTPKMPPPPPFPSGPASSPPAPPPPGPTTTATVRDGASQNPALDTAPIADRPDYDTNKNELRQTWGVRQPDVANDEAPTRYVGPRPKVEQKTHGPIVEGMERTYEGKADDSVEALTKRNTILQNQLLAMDRSAREKREKTIDDAQDNVRQAESVDIVRRADYDKAKEEEAKLAKLDPERLSKNKNVAQRIFGFIGLALGGQRVQDQMNKEIDRDIAAQQHEYERAKGRTDRARTAWEDAVKQYGSVKAARENLKAAKQDAIQDIMAYKATQMGSAKAFQELQNYKMDVAKQHLQIGYGDYVFQQLPTGGLVMKTPDGSWIPVTAAEKLQWEEKRLQRAHEREQTGQKLPLEYGKTIAEQSGGAKIAPQVTSGSQHDIEQKNPERRAFLERAEAIKPEDVSTPAQIIRRTGPLGRAAVDIAAPEQGKYGRVIDSASSLSKDGKGMAPVTGSGLEELVNAEREKLNQGERSVEAGYTSPRAREIYRNSIARPSTFKKVGR